MICMTFYLVAVMLTYPIQSYPGTMVVLDVIEKHDPAVVPAQETLNKIESVAKPIFVLITCKLLSTKPIKIFATV